MRPSTSGTMPGVKPPTTTLDTISESGAALTRDRLDQEGRTQGNALFCVYGASAESAMLPERLTAD